MNPSYRIDVLFRMYVCRHPPNSTFFSSTHTLYPLVRMAAHSRPPNPLPGYNDIVFTHLFSLLLLNIKIKYAIYRFEASIAILQLSAISYSFSAEVKQSSSLFY